MDTLSRKDKEVIIMYFALRLMMDAVYAVRDHWAEEDIRIAENLLSRVKMRRQKIMADRNREHASHPD